MTSAASANMGMDRKPASAQEGDGSATPPPKTWYHEQKTWPMVQPAIANIMSRRQARSTPVCLRDVHQLPKVAATPAASCPKWTDAVPGKPGSRSRLLMPMMTRTGASATVSKRPGCFVVITFHRRR